MVSGEVKEAAVQKFERMTVAFRARRGQCASDFANAALHFSLTGFAAHDDTRLQTHQRL
jgi:hypothetical protein